MLHLCTTLLLFLVLSGRSGTHVGFALHGGLALGNLDADTSNSVTDAFGFFDADAGLF